MIGKEETWRIKRRDIHSSGDMIPMMAGRTDEAEGSLHSLLLFLSHVRGSRWLFTELPETHGSASVEIFYKPLLPLK